MEMGLLMAMDIQMEVTTATLLLMVMEMVIPMGMV